MMQPLKSTIVALAAAIATALVIQVGIEAVDVNVEHDKAFDFKPGAHLGLESEGAGRRADGPHPGRRSGAAMKQALEPTIVDAVATEMTRLGLTQAASGPDVTVTYFLLLSTNMSTQTVGQFLPATSAWGLPLFAPATQSLKVMNQGSLVLDLSAKGAVVWRGVAQAKLDLERR